MVGERLGGDIPVSIAGMRRFRVRLAWGHHYGTRNRAPEYAGYLIPAVVIRTRYDFLGPRARRQPV